MLKNDLLLRALRQEEVERPPVWMMRQAGRYLPEFIELKDKFDFFTRCRTPQIASELTVQPLRRFPIDAAILFSDILVIPQAMGAEVELKPNFGPYLPNPVRTQVDVDNLVVPNVNIELDYVFEAIQLTKEKLDNSVPLFGFAGSPWTILCYLVQGQGSKTFDLAKKFCFTQPQAAHNLLQKITDTTIAYLKQKIAVGCDLVQLFDSWGGLLSPEDYRIWSWSYLQQIITALKDLAPVVVFAKGAWYALDEMSKSGAAGLGVDWSCSPEMARKLTNNSITLQGNFDPARLYSEPAEIQKLVTNMIDQFGVNKYIVNLGHGILPDIKIPNVETFVNAVVNYKK